LYYDFDEASDFNLDVDFRLDYLINYTYILFILVDAYYKRYSFKQELMLLLPFFYYCLEENSWLR